MFKFQHATLAIALACAASATFASGNVMLEPVAVSTNMGSALSPFYDVGRTIDQSGLSAGYTSGSTDFATYMAGSPLHDSSVGGNVGWISSASHTTGDVNFDLGAVYTLSEMAYWAYSSTETRNIQNFVLLAGKLADFSDAVVLGSFIATNPTFANFPNHAGESFSFAATDARYVRLSIGSNYGDNIFTGLGEVAFGGTTVANVPEPGTMALVAVGALGFAARRRSRQG